MAVYYENHTKPIHTYTHMQKQSYRMFKQVTYIVTTSYEGLKMLRSLWNPKIHCCAQKSSPLDHILSQLNPIACSHSVYFKCNFNIILLPKRRSPQWSCPSRILDYSFIHTSVLMCTRCSWHFMTPDLMAVVIFSKEYKLWSSFLCNSPHFLLFTTCYTHIFSSVPFPQTAPDSHRPVCSFYYGV
jgi:hypothetical protein